MNLVWRIQAGLAVLYGALPGRGSRDVGLDGIDIVIVRGLDIRLVHAGTTGELRHSFLKLRADGTRLLSCCLQVVQNPVNVVLCHVGWCATIVFCNKRLLFVKIILSCAIPGTSRHLGIQIRQSGINVVDHLSAGRRTIHMRLCQSDAALACLRNQFQRLRQLISHV